MLRAGKGYAAAFGRRPRLATAWPGILPAQASHRSACFEPRRASVKLIRITAPLASSTSLPQLSQTSLVTRATEFPPVELDFPRMSLAERSEELGRGSRLLNSPRSEQAEQGLFFQVEPDITSAYYP